MNPHHHHHFVIRPRRTYIAEIITVYCRFQLFISRMPKSRVAKKEILKRKRDADNEDEPHSPEPPRTVVSETVSETLASSSSSQVARRQKKEVRAEPLHLDVDQETQVSEFLKDNPFLYTKGDRDFKNAKLKIAKWEEMADLLGVASDKLLTWYNTIRTRIGKLTTDKSGQPPPNFSDRDQEILTAFAFLKDHIVRVPGRVAVSVSIII